MQINVFYIGLLAGVVLLMLPKNWKIPKAGLEYAPYFADAEARFNLPHNLLARVAEQESSFRPEVISGEVRSPAGAVGLMQIVPRWHPSVDPTDPIESIYYAAEYLSDMYRVYGNWQMALAAYNWGPGNLDSNGLHAAPAETRNYIRSISRDVVLA